MLEIEKYGVELNPTALLGNINYLTNQMWKLIPMREHEEDWKTQANTVLIEIAGLQSLFVDESKYMNIFIKLEGLLNFDVEFKLYRKTVFECISLLHEVKKRWQD